MKLNKAEKFVNAQIKLGKTRNGVRLAIFQKFRTWNFPPEYENALATQDPNYEPVLGVDYLDDYVCEQCDNCHELCFCEEEEKTVFGNQTTEHEKCVFCQKAPCICEVVKLPKLPEPGTPKWETFVESIRELEKYSPLIQHAKKVIEASGRDFNEEFEKWKKKQGGLNNV